ncbi:MAG: hypothetical protein Q9218_000166 [Villophora microphyllina]
MNRKLFSHHPTIILFLISTLLSSIFAADHPPNTDVYWFYPAALPTNQNLTYNTLDTLNVSWISSHTPTFLNLACQNDNAYTSVLKTQVPATGNRLVGLGIASGYQGCHFEISAPSVMLNISHGVGFMMTDQQDKTPVFWTSGSSSMTGNNGSCAAAASESRNGDGNNRYKMVGIGVGVAVGVFAITTAGWLLIETQRRKRRSRGRSTDVDASGKGRDSRIKEWVKETTREGGIEQCTCVHHHHDLPVTKSWELDPDSGQRHKICGNPMAEIDTSKAGCAG